MIPLRIFLDSLIQRCLFLVVKVDHVADISSLSKPYILTLVRVVIAVVIYRPGQIALILHFYLDVLPK